jgi:hypothetical protein
MKPLTAVTHFSYWGGTHRDGANGAQNDSDPSGRQCNLELAEKIFPGIRIVHCGNVVVISPQASSHMGKAPSLSWGAAMKPRSKIDRGKKHFQRKLRCRDSAAAGSRLTTKSSAAANLPPPDSRRGLDIGNGGQADITNLCCGNQAAVARPPPRVMASLLPIGHRLFIDARMRFPEDLDAKPGQTTANNFVQLQKVNG